MNKLKKVYKKLCDPKWRARKKYLKYYDSLPIDEKSILLEASHGKEISGNIFYLLKYLLHNEEYNEFSIYLGVKSERKDTFKKVLKAYELEKIHLVEILSDEYYKIIASAKYLINDTTFLPFFIKKQEQIYLNTWHGTPLKTLGKQVKNDAYTMGNVQKNFLNADFILFPNEHTKEVILRDYMIENISKGAYIMGGYPRNEILLKDDCKRLDSGETDIYLKRLYAYMPTYRGTVEEPGSQKSMAYLIYYLHELDSKLNEGEILYVNLHPFTKKEVDFSRFRHIRCFPEEYETYDFLSRVDVLVTDYSSVFFDFACTRKKIILFTYDKEEYLRDRGLYMPLDDLPFPQVCGIDDLLKELRTEKKYNDSFFIEEYCSYENELASKKLCDYVILGKKNDLIVDKIPNNGRENVLLYAGNLSLNGITTSIRNLMYSIDRDKRNYYLCFKGKKIAPNYENLFSFPDNMNYFSMMGSRNTTYIDMVINMLFNWKVISANSYMRLCQKRIVQEYKRCFGESQFDHVIQFNGYESNLILNFSTFNGNNIIYVHNNMLDEIKTRGNQRKDVLHYAYNRYSKVVVVTSDLIESTSSISGKKDNIHIARNLIDYKSILLKAEEPITILDKKRGTIEENELVSLLKSDKKCFINIGRFSPEKGHERLVDAFYLYKRENPNSALIIMGGNSRGKQYEKIVDKIQKMQLSDSVFLLEKISNPYPILKACDYFVLSSYYEGFGLVLAEADILGLPVVSTDIIGPRTFMNNHKGTLVSNSTEGILEGLKRLYSGEIKTMDVDYEKYNLEACQEFENLFLN